MAKKCGLEFLPLGMQNRVFAMRDGRDVKHQMPNVPNFPRNCVKIARGNHQTETLSANSNLRRDICVRIFLKNTMLDEKAV